jgi:recombination protein RecT
MATTTQTPNPPAAAPPNGGAALTVTDRKFLTLRHMIEHKGVMEQIQSALPRQLTAERFTRVALTSLRKTPALLDCAPASVVGSIIQAAQLGLEPDGVLGQAYLIPYKGECQLQVGYRGFINLSRRSGEIKSFSPQIVREGDAFRYEYGTEAYLRHKPAEDNDEAPITHVYAVVEYTNGGTDFEVMSKVGVEKIRATSKAPNSPAWKEHWGEMAKKTVMRRLAKRLPMAAEESALVKAAVLDEMADAGVSQESSKLIDAQDIVRSATQAHTEQLSKKYGVQPNGKPMSEAEKSAELAAAQTSANATGKPVGVDLGDGKGLHWVNPADPSQAPESVSTSPAPQEESFDPKAEAERLLASNRAQYQHRSTGAAPSASQMGFAESPEEGGRFGE